MLDPIIDLLPRPDNASLEGRCYSLCPTGMPIVSHATFCPQVADLQQQLDAHSLSEQQLKAEYQSRMAQMIQEVRVRPQHVLLA